MSGPARITTVGAAERLSTTTPDALDESVPATDTTRWRDDNSAKSAQPAAVTRLRVVGAGRESVPVDDGPRREPDKRRRWWPLTAPGAARSSRAGLVGAVTILAALALVAALSGLLGGRFGSVAQDPRGGVAGAVGRPTLRPSPASTTAASSTHAPTAAPPASMPASVAPVGAVAAVEVTEQALRTWTDQYGEVRAEVIAVVRNSGRVPATLAGGSTRYTIAAPDGTVVASGVFARSFPYAIAPGKAGYLIDAVPATFVQARDLSKLKLEIAARPASAPTSTLVVDGLTWATEHGALTVSGTVRNTGQTAADHVVVAAILRDADGRIVCAVYDAGTLSSLAPGQTATFRTAYPASAPVPAAAISRADGVAFAEPEG